jgi:alpha-D-ribose 1-methylphosphonate 5-triphosphate synthase subunit PhnH
MIEAVGPQLPGQAARCFRKVLDSFAKPGTRVELPPLGDLSATLNAASASLALVLFDFQTALWLSPLLDRQDVRDFLRFRTGVPLVQEPGNAAFAICMASEFAGIHPRLSKGSAEYPDRSTTAVVQVQDFEAPQRVKLQGPGIRDAAVMSAAGFSLHEWTLLADDRILFPLGIDVALTSAASLVAIPRSTRITCLEDR